MKTFPAYNIDPAKLFEALKNAGHPIQEIRHRGPARKSVVLACVCVADGANDAGVRDVIVANSGENPKIDRQDEHIEALGEGVGMKLTSYKG